MGTNRHQVGGRCVVILAAAFTAGMIAAIAVSLDPSSWTITEPYFGLPDEVATVSRDFPSAPAPAVPVAPRHAPVSITQRPPAAATRAHALATPEPPPARMKPAEPTLASPPPPPMMPALLPPPPQLVPLAPRCAERSVPRRVPTAAPPLVSVGGERAEVNEPVREATVTDAPDLQALPATPLPGANWSDPDGVNWFDATGSKPSSAASPPASRPSTGGRMLDRFSDRLSEARGDSQPQQRAPVLLGDRLRSRLRGENRIARGLNTTADDTPTAEAAASDGWPTPVQLLEDLERLAASSGGEAGGAITHWAKDTLDVIHKTLTTDGPADPQAAEPLLVLSERVSAGMAVADEGASPAIASQTRRAALALARRVAVWRAAVAWCGEDNVGSPASGSDVSLQLDPPSLADDACLLLACLERYEASVSAADATTVRMALAAIAESKASTAVALARTVSDHYHAANVRIAVHREFVSRMLPESTVTTNAVQDFVLGRPVKGRSTVEQSLAMRFVPHPTEIRMELVVNGEVASRTVTASGPVAIHSTGQATFAVSKPIVVSPSGISFGSARGTAASNARLASVETSFDKVPIMSSIVRTIAKNQAEESRQEANREVSNKVLGRACRQVDQEAEPKLSGMAEQIREKVWKG